MDEPCCSHCFWFEQCVKSNVVVSEVECGACQHFFFISSDGEEETREDVDPEYSVCGTPFECAGFEEFDSFVDFALYEHGSNGVCVRRDSK